MNPRKARLKGLSKANRSRGFTEFRQSTEGGTGMGRDTR